MEIRTENILSEVLTVFFNSSMVSDMGVPSSVSP